MQGVRVVELGFWVAGPSAAGILADWGADVVKLEPPDGDPFRALYLALVGQAMPVNPPFELDNRGKRSIALDLTRPEGRELAYRLIDGADVFVSNFRPEILERFGLDYPTLSRRNPRLVYGSVTGYGLDGPDRDRPAYDVGAFWSRAGIAAALTAPGGDPPMQRGAMGDHATGMTAAGGIAAALFAREKSGRGQLVSTSLLRVGVFTLGWDINSLLMLDGKWFWLLGLEGDRHWPDLVRSVGKPEWLADPRFATIQARTANCGVLTAALDEVFAARPRAEWTAIFDREGMWWAPLQSTDEVVRDPQAIAAGSFVDVPRDGAPPARMVATPLDFSDTRWEARAVAPELGQHTEELLLELGYDWDAIAAFKEKGVIP
jgi:crotonobetainyl-CoA:carnitine CoA-transferase CaiB-like acyl-CoA transferase